MYLKIIPSVWFLLWDKSFFKEVYCYLQLPAYKQYMNVIEHIATLEWQPASVFWWFCDTCFLLLSQSTSVIIAPSKMDDKVVRKIFLFWFPNFVT